MHFDLVGRYGRYNTYNAVLGRGAEGQIVPVLGSQRVVFKQYSSDHPLVRSRDFGPLWRVIELGRTALEALGNLALHGDGRTLAGALNWPIDAIITDDGELRGVILPHVPVQYYDRGKLRDFGRLSFRRYAPNAAVRVRVLMRLCDIFNVLRQKHLVHGDISWTNMLWSYEDGGRAYLIDCDSLAYEGETRPRHGTFGWEDPRRLDRGDVAPDHQADAFALGAAIFRGLALELSLPLRLAEVPDVVPPPLRRMFVDLTSAQSLDCVFPTPSVWLERLRDTYGPANALNVGAVALLDEGIGWQPHSP